MLNENNMKNLTLELISKNPDAFFEYVRKVAWKISNNKANSEELPLYYSIAFHSELTSSSDFPPLICHHCQKETLRPYKYFSSYGSGLHSFSAICTNCLHIEKNLKNPDYHRIFIKEFFNKNIDNKIKK